MKVSHTNKLYIIYLFTMGWLIIILYIYFRFIKQRERYSLGLLKDNITPFGYILCINFLLINLVAIISIVYMLYKQYYKIERSSKIIAYISKLVDILYWKPLEYIHDIIAPDLPYSGTVIIWITEFLEKGSQELRYKMYRHSYILFDYLPQILASIIFFIDIVMLNQLHYFLYSIGLLLIPLLYKIYLKLCHSFVTRNEPDHLEALEIKPQGDRNEDGIYLQFHFSLKSKYVPNAALLEEYVNDYFLLQRIKLHVTAIKKNSAKHYPYLILFTSSLYFIAGIYRLIYVLYVY